MRVRHSTVWVEAGCRVWGCFAGGAEGKVAAMEKNAKDNTALPPDIAKLSFEDAMAELEAIVKQLEGGKAKLEDAIGAYERGALLRSHCEAKLRAAQMRIEQISLAADGSPRLAPSSL